MSLKPLRGIRVLDFTAMPPGGFCTVILADLGAEVIRVEPPAQKGKTSLVIGQVALSRGKRSLTLDMRSPEASSVLKRLIRNIDVVVENAKPGSMQSRGFGYAQARVENKRVIWCAITGFGQTGPYAERGGHDVSYLAHSGLLSALSPDPEWQPGISLSLQAGAMAAVIGIQSALLARGPTSTGAFLDISLAEAASWYLTCGINPLSDRPYLIPSTPDRRLYKCGDGRYVAVASSEPRSWAALCDGVGLPELKGALHKVDQAASATEKLAVTFLGGAAQQWVESLAPHGVTITAVNHGRQLLEDPHVVARAAVVEVAGTPVPANPVRVSVDGESTGTALGAPPQVGADTTDILQAAGFSGDELRALEQQSII